MDKATSGSALHTPGLSDHDLAGEGGKTLRHVARYNPREKKKAKKKREKKRRIQTRGTIEHKPELAQREARRRALGNASEPQHPVP